MSEEIAQQLIQAREIRGEHLNEVHERSGISVTILKGLEAACFETVEPIYMRMGLRAYSEYLNLDTEVLLAAFDREVTTKLPIPPSAPPHARGGNGSSLIRRPFLVGGALLAILIVAWVVVSQLSDDDEPESVLVAPWVDALTELENNEPGVPTNAAVAEEVSTVDNLQVAEELIEPTELDTTDSEVIESIVARGAAPIPNLPPTTAITAAATPATQPDTNAEGTPVTAVEGMADPLVYPELVLEMEAIDSTWVQVSCDNTNYFQGMLVPGLKRRWMAHEEFFVHSGRAHGARYWLQGKLLGNGRLGEATKVLRFRANSDGITLLGPELEPLPRMLSTTSTVEQ